MQTFHLDISQKGVPPILTVKQGDVGRKFNAILTDGGTAYVVPEDAVFSVWYAGSSGEGNYSSVGEREAITIDGNKVTVEVIAQMVTKPGGGNLCLVLSEVDGSQIGLWNIAYIVEAVPGMGSPAAEQYYTALSETASLAAVSAAEAKRAAATFVTDASLSVPQKAADAAATGQAIDVERARINQLVAMRGGNGSVTTFEMTDSALTPGSIVSNGVMAYIDCHVSLTIGSGTYANYYIPESLAPVASQVFYLDGGLNETATNVPCTIMVEEETGKPMLSFYNTSVHTLGIAGYLRGHYALSSISIPEVIDARVGSDGTTHNTAGDAIRSISVNYSQGRSAKYYVYTPGWKRILNLIRVSNGTLTVGVAKAKAASGYSCQALAVDFACNVNFPASDVDTKPVIYQRYDHEFGENNSDDATRRARITQVRIGYPAAGTAFPDSDGTVNYETNPVNCYVDVYVDFEPQFEGDRCQLDINYAGFAESHNCEAITEETDASDTGIYGETLTYHALTLNPDADIYMPDGRIDAKKVYAENMPFEFLSSTTDKPVTLRDLPTGIYYIQGKGYYYEGKALAFTQGLYIVKRTAAQSDVLRLSPEMSMVRYYAITDTSHTNTACDLSAIVTNAEKIVELEERITALENASKTVFSLHGEEFMVEAGTTWWDLIVSEGLTILCPDCNDSAEVMTENADSYVYVTCPGACAGSWALGVWDEETGEFIHSIASDVIEAKEYDINY